ncbi:MAG: precorrin-6y C5,15-methyltransferase (decarboxylating) subunit CbiE [Devosia nanyangense]|uniref:Precorrin-6y C5,15-methyltransferase (Decarboxylating) subunit CbiE n=1 Tax=Devosia nanyangense TaxID=1228055 RepID=A0A933NVU6_9HYPH|nr:precorrin-6y C5,15-methyltransferase (decarboxylating) subunit CbiE [Devosia nanyangense]
MTAWLDIVGVGEGGVSDLPPVSAAIVTAAKTVLGPKRLLDGLSSAARKVEWEPTLDAMLAQVKRRRNTATVVLASGDPLWFGIGATLAKHLDAAEFGVHPSPSSFQLAAARLRWPLQHLATVSLHARPPELLHPHVAPGNRVLALTSDATTAPHVARLLAERGYGRSILTVLENLGGAGERIASAEALGFDLAPGDFYVLAVDCAADPGAALLPPVPGLPDDAFVSDGQLTKREVRAATLAKLAPYPGALLWDVGAGCGSIGIEWMRAARDAHAVAFEREGERLQMIAVNAARLGVPGIRIENGEAPDSLAGMPVPDAVFLGGGVADETLFHTCWTALRRGGRFVANAVTLEGEQALYARQGRLGGDLVRIDVAILDSIGEHRALRPRMAVTQWSVTKP